MVIMMITARFLMTKTMIIMIMEELAIIKIVTVIMMTYRQNSMEEKTLELMKKKIG